MVKIIKKNKVIEIEVDGKTKRFKEGDILKRKFLDGTEDTYDCEIILKDVGIVDMRTGDETGEFETKAFTRRVGEAGWIMLLDETTINEYYI